MAIRPCKGGDGLKYTVPMSVMPKLGQINSTIQEPRARYDAVMALADLVHGRADHVAPNPPNPVTRDTIASAARASAQPVLRHATC